MTPQVSRVVPSGVRRGFTLVEMMIAMVITLMVVYAMVEAFRWIGEATTEGRATIELSGQLRQARFRLEDDLARCTAPLVPWKLTAGNGKGYVEVIEGSVGHDNNTPLNPGRYLVRNASGQLTYASFNFNDPNDTSRIGWWSLFGDLDDIIMFTARNDSVPFRGRYVNPMTGTTVMIESNLAEIIWWAELNDTSAPYGEWNPGETFTIRRRVLLVRPDLNVDGLLPTGVANPTDFLRDNDISVRMRFDDTNYNYQGLAANSLGDLTYRHNRTAHLPIDYSLVNANGTPRGLSQGQVMSPLSPAVLPAHAASRAGEDILATNVLAFDVRVWDPEVPVQAASGEGLVPGDPGYDLMAGGVGRGAFIDLGASLLTAQSHFTNNMEPRARLNDGLGNSVYDPWTIDYERDGFDQDGMYGVDQGTNGDDDPDYLTGQRQNGPDDLGERETFPPYPHPLKSIQVRIRMYESDTRQVRQASQIIRFQNE
jgi:prepilin-type N-terminal cleavage/methylation domain-containing protein